jgi:signal peptidase II
VKAKITLLGVILPVVLLLDRMTKQWAETSLAGRRMELLDGLVPLTLAHNRGAAFGLEFGSNPKMFFIPITVLALVLLGTLLVQAGNRDYLRVVAVSLVISGAIGNLYDRVTNALGVVDFIGPINLGFMRWPIFNGADIAITTGAVLLAISFWMEEQVGETEEPAPNPVPEPSG